MAKRKTKAKRAPSSRRTTRRHPSPPAEPLISIEAARTIGGVLLLLVSVVLLLSLVGVAGPLGKALADWAGQLLGWAAIGLPLAAGWFGWQLVRQQRINRHELVGSLIILASVSAVLHLLVTSDPLAAAQAGRFGGLVGYGLTTTVGYAVGDIGSFVVFVALLAVGIIVAANRPLSRRSPDEVPAATADSPTPVAPPAPAPRPVTPSRSPEPDFQPRQVDSSWEQPPVTLLSEASAAAIAGDTKRSSEIIERTLANFGVVGAVENVNVGPSVSQYELRPEAGVKLNQITALNNDLALALAAHPIRIEAPIPGKSTVGIEVPNQQAATVRLRSLFDSPRWKKSGALPLALGLDVAGQPVISDLSAMPHLLIAGATGSGKSVGINTILLSLLYTHSPKHLRLLLVDPKRVELTAYNDVPHLIAPVIVDAPKVVNALKWVVAEMDRRYQIFQEARVKNLVEYNKSRRDETLPYLVVVVDELADLMAVSGKAVEAAIVRIAQLARATGIHLILATQRPSVDVITGLIKANFPSRIAFTVTSGTDSRTILDTAGAEKLLGHGDMLFMPGNISKPIRVQGAFVDSSEVKRVTDFLKGKAAPAYDDAVTEAAARGEGSLGDDAADDPLYAEARAEVIRSRKASASLLQRRLKVGYARAARLLDMLEENGVIGPGEGAKPREILVESDE